VLPRLTLAQRTLVTLVVSVALVPAVAGAARATPDGPDYQAPKVGECRNIDLTAASQASDDTAPTDCANAHTLRVIAVGHLPDGVAWSQDASVEKTAIRACQPAWNQALGRTLPVRDMSAYTYFWFEPTKAQRSHGARWIRCDLGLQGGSKILALPTDKTPALDQPPLRTKVARCLTSRTFATTSCARTHAWRATGTFVMTSDTFPGAKAIRAAAVRKCPSRVSTDSYRWTYKLRLLWNVGKDHVVVCYSKKTT